MTNKRPGVQVLSRAADLLRVVSSAMPNGLSTTDAARKAGITRPTAHRILDSLASEGFCDQDAQTGQWLLGPELFLMGSVAATRYDMTELAMDHVSELAQTTGESAFFSVMRGKEAICLLHQDGPYPIRSFVLYEGRRFPLGVASAGLAILAFMPENYTNQYLAENDLTAEYSETHNVPALQERISDGRQRGYVTNPGLIVEGNWGLAVAVFDNSGYPIAAISLTGIESRFTAERRPHLGRLLMRHAHELSIKLQQPHRS